MVVGGVSRAATGTTPTRRGPGEVSFRVNADKAGSADAAVATTGVAMTSLLAMQEAESDAQQDREARRHGQAVIDELAELQRALLGEARPDLERLARLMDRPSAAADPGLASVMRAIRLRAGIELARRSHAASM